MIREYTRHREWELHLEWVWDQMLDAEHGRIRIAPDTLALAAVEAVKARIEEAAQGAAQPGQRDQEADAARDA